MIPFMRTTINMIAASLMISGILLLIVLFLYYICIIIDTYQLGKERRNLAKKIREKKIEELKSKEVLQNKIKEEKVK